MSELSQHAKLIKAIEIAKGAQVGIELSYFDVLEVAGELNEAKEVVAMLNARIAELEAEVTKCHELQDSYCDRIAELEAEKCWIPVSEPPKECEMRVFKDGNAWCFVLPDFQDLQVSPSVWAKKGVLDKIYKELRSMRDE